MKIHTMKTYRIEWCLRAWISESDEHSKLSRCITLGKLSCVNLGKVSADPSSFAYGWG